MTAPFPHQYGVDLSSDGPQRGILAAGTRPCIVGGPPSEFGGRDDWWSPEHLLLASVALCTMTTFQALAAREKLVSQRCRCHAEGTVDKTPSGLAFTAIRIRVELSVAEADVARAATVLDRAKRHCLVAASLTCPVTVNGDVSTSRA